MYLELQKFPHRYIALGHKQSYTHILILPYCPYLMVQFINIASNPNGIIYFSPFARYFSSAYKSFVYLYLFIFVNWYMNHTILKTSLLLLSAINTPSLVRIHTTNYIFQNRSCCTPQYMFFCTEPLHTTHYSSSYCLSLYKQTYILQISPIVLELRADSRMI